MALSYSQTIFYTVKYTRSVWYLDLAASEYEKLDTEAKIAKAVNRVKYGYDSITYRSAARERFILESISEFYDNIIIDFFKEFEDKIFRDIFEEDQEEYYIERYLAACRITDILDVDHEKSVLRQNVLFTLLNILFKDKLYSPDSGLFVNFLETFCNEFILGNRLYTDEEYMKYLDLILEQCKRMKYMLWGAWPTYSLKGESYNAVSTYLFMGNLTYLKLIFKYGIDYAFSMSAYKITCRIFSHLKHEGISIMKEATLNTLLLHKNRKRLHLILLNFCIFYLTTERTKFNNMLCLSTAWRSISDAHVTAEEMDKILKPSVKTHFEWIFKKTVELYRDSIFCDAEYTPRTLAHQCRVAIRRILSKDFNLPEGVKEFIIPETLKDFLSLEW